jgi:hypothetical protein
MKDETIHFLMMHPTTDMKFTIEEIPWTMTLGSQKRTILVVPLMMQLLNLVF